MSDAIFHSVSFARQILPLFSLVYLSLIYACDLAHMPRQRSPPCATCTVFIFLLSYCAGNKQKTFGLQRKMPYNGFFRMLSVQQMEANKQVNAISN